ncbi:lipopolysaccharide biosynthesis protein [Aeromonas media]|uniref:lipopolysaccharide biosynthesis protein n=1 Tax=Aeromonas media TaxID=651 RepID=UPI00111ACF0E|nr:oligosaccharide flippase family protein [Aeromonas media]
MTNKTSLKNRLIKGIGANAYGQAITVLIQLVSVPLFIHYWGIAVYGEWLILSALPAYLSMSDFGLGAVAGNSMVIKMAQNDRVGAISIYHSVTCFNACVSLLILLMILALLFVFGLPNYLGVHMLLSMDVKLTLLLLSLQVLVGLQISVLSAGYRSLERYAEVTVLNSTSRLIQWAMGMAMLISGGGVVYVAAGMLAGWVLGYCITYFRLQKLESEYHFSITKGSWQIMKELLRSGLTFLAFPLGLALSLQGMIVVIGSVLGAVAVAQFSVLRTVVRILVQLVNVLNQATWPEISRAYGANNLKLAQALHINGCRFALFIGLIGVASLLSFSEFIFHLWLGSTVSLPFLTFSLLLAGALVNITSQASWVVLMATNRHQQFAVMFIFVSCISIILAYLTMPFWGLNAAAVAILLAELSILVLAIKEANLVLQEPVYKFMIKFIKIDM